MRERTALVVVGSLSAGLIALELSWTRIFSAEFFYSFAFLILSLAILGLGLGALALRLFPRLSGPHTVSVSLTVAGFATVASPILVFRLGLDFSRLLASPWMLVKLVGAIVLLSSAFFAGGIALALLFRSGHRDMPRLYMADLVGAGLGVVLALAAMHHLGTPTATLLSALPLLGAAWLTGRGAWRWAALPIAATAVVLTAWAPALLRAERAERAPVVYEHWDEMAKVKVYAYGEDARGINIDNVANSPVIAFDGNFEDPDLRDAQWAIDVGWLIDRFGGKARFLSLGAGGGGDVLQALAKGAVEVHAVEVNPHINRMMLDGDPSGYLETPILPPSSDGEVPEVPAIRRDDGRVITEAEFSGWIYRDPRVRVVSEDARTYVRRHRAGFDVIYSLSSNTWAALGSGSFAFAESYLFTREAFEDYWHALSDDGFLSLEHQVYMPRLVSAALEALKELGVEDPAAHLAVYELPRMRRNLMLLSKRPLTDEVRRMAYGELTPDREQDIRLLWPAANGTGDDLIHRIVTEGWRAVAPEASIDISPTDDDRPFVAQMGLWRNFDLASLGDRAEMSELRGWPLSQAIIVVILLVVVVLVLPLNLVPFVRGGQRLAPRHWLYFFTIGVAFMFVEVVLMQKYALFIGASVWSISTVLLVLLVASGLGSRFSPGVRDRTVFLSIAGLVVLHALLGGPVTSVLSGLPAWGRIGVTAALVAPLGVVMGMPFPKGALRVGPLIDWGFAVNGAASVLGATAVVLVAFTWGFTAALLAAAAAYLVAWRLLGPAPCAET